MLRAQDVDGVHQLDVERVLAGGGGGSAVEDDVAAVDGLGDLVQIAQVALNHGSARDSCVADVEDSDIVLAGLHQLFDEMLTQEAKSAGDQALAAGLGASADCHAAGIEDEANTKERVKASLVVELLILMVTFTSSCWPSLP